VRAHLLRRRGPAAGLLASLAVLAGCATPAAPQAPAPAAAPASATAAATLITAPQGPLEARLPCNRPQAAAVTPQCSLRIYHVMTGSFVDGDPQVGVRDAWGPGPHRGDIQGVIDALPFIQEAGFNAVWLTPVFDSRAGEPQVRADGTRVVDLRLDGTGYFARDFFAVDPQFGTRADLQRLARVARERGIGLILDGVLGHHKGAPAPSPSGLVPMDSQVAADYQGQIAGYPGAVTDWRDPATRAFFREMMLHWTRELGLTGWRLDQAYQVPPDGWRELEPQVAQAARAAGGTGLMVGEVWGSADEMLATFGTEAAPGLSTLFDFPTRYALVQAVAGDESGKRAPASTINAAWAMGAHGRYPGFAIPALMIGNHDLVRLGDLIERAGLGGPDSASYWARHRLAFLFLAAWSGPVTVYYGEEVGQELPGFAAKVEAGCGAIHRCDDHVARAPAQIPGLTAPAASFRPEALALRTDVAAWLRLRDQVPALATGARQHLFSDATAFLDLKRAPGSCALLALNTGDAPRALRIAASALGGVSAGASVVAGSADLDVAAPDALGIALPPLGGAIIRLACA
jgi:glycosidase